MFTRLKLILPVAAALLCAAPAHATVVNSPDVLVQQIASQSLMPVPTGVTVSEDEKLGAQICGSGAAACAAGATVFLVDPLWTMRTLLHEMGHEADREFLTAAQREALKELPGVTGKSAATRSWGMPWYQPVVSSQASMGERLGEVYSICASYALKNLHRGSWVNGAYGVQMSTVGMRRTCPVIKSFLLADGAQMPAGSGR